MWIGLALGAALLTSFNPIIYKRLLVNADVPVVAWAAQALALPLLAAGTWVITRGAPWPSVDGWFYLGVIGSAVLNVVAQLALTSALQQSDASLVTPFLAFAPLFTVVIAGITLGERPTLLGWLGVGLVVPGAYVINQKPGQRWTEPSRAFATQRGIQLGLLASLIWGLTPVFEKTAILHTTPENPSLVAFAVNTGLALLLFPMAVRRPARAVRQIRQHPWGFVATGLIGGVAPLLGYAAFSLGLVGPVSALFKLSGVLTLVWSDLLLRETDLRWRWPGALLMLAGGALIAK